MSISGLVTTSALTAVENNIADVINLIKNWYDTKIIETEKKVTDHDHDKFTTFQEFNNVTAKLFDARLAQGDLIRKTDFDNKLISFNQRIKQSIFLLKMN